MNTLNKFLSSIFTGLLFVLLWLRGMKIFSECMNGPVRTSNNRQLALSSSRPRRDDWYNFEVVQSIASKPYLVPYHFSSVWKRSQKDLFSSEPSPIVVLLKYDPAGSFIDRFVYWPLSNSIIICTMLSKSWSCRRRKSQGRTPINLQYLYNSANQAQWFCVLRIKERRRFPRTCLDIQN